MNPGRRDPNTGDPEIALDADGCLVSPRFGDVYCNRDGVAEGMHIFLAGNRLEARWRSWSPSDRPFVVAETGFGTGLNCLLAARWFERVAPAGARLVFVSTERYPLSAEQLEFAHQRLDAGWHADAARLRAAWPERVRERSVWRFPLGARVIVQLLVGDAAQRLAETTFAADAWFLDGFAPSKNPGMWSPELLGLIGERTRRGGTFATFTVAGAVRRGLAAAGFALERSPGFGRKREMLVGTATGAPEERPWLPWFADRAPPRRVQVFGAGIAGACAAARFAARGASVQVVDPHGVAAGASGLAAAVRQPRLWTGTAPDAELVAAAFRLDAEQRPGASGVLRAATGPESARRLRERAGNPLTADLVRWVDGPEASERAGVALPFGAVWIPRADVVDLGAEVRRLLADPAIEVVRSGAAFAPDLLVLATAGAPLAQRIGRVLPMQATRGQMVAVRWGTRAGPRVPICPGGYVVPPGPDGIGWVGSSYERDDRCEARVEDDAAVLARFEGLDELASTLRDLPVVDRFAGLRAVSYDRLPYVGPLPREAAFLGAFATPLRRGVAGSREAGMGAFVHATVVSLAHGSRGAVTGPLSGELLAAAAFGEVAPVAPRLLDRVHAARYLVRCGVRGEAPGF